MRILRITHLPIFILSFVVFTSCEKAKIPNTGYFSEVATASRSIASIQTNEQMPDSKQVLIYCHNKRNQIKKCYYDNAQKLKLNTALHTYKKTEGQLKKITTDYLLSLDNKLTGIIKDREIFCNKNSLYNYTRCLKSNSKKRTMQLLNDSHKTAKFNPHEYLYLKRVIQTELDKKYEQKILARLTK